MVNDVTYKELHGGLDEKGKKFFKKGVERVLLEMTPKERRADKKFNRENNQGKEIGEYETYSPQFMEAQQRVSYKNSEQYKSQKEKNDAIDARDKQVLQSMSYIDRFREYRHRKAFLKDDSDVMESHTKAYAEASTKLSIQEQAKAKEERKDAIEKAEKERKEAFAELPQNEVVDEVTKEVNLTSKISELLKNKKEEVIVDKTLSHQNSPTLKHKTLSQEKVSVHPLSVETAYIDNSRSSLVDKSSRTSSTVSVTKDNSSRSSVSSNNSATNSPENSNKGQRFPVYNYLKNKRPVRTAVSNFIKRVTNRNKSQDQWQTH